MPDRPEVVLQLAEHFLEGEFGLKELLGQAPPGWWPGLYKSVLDLTTDLDESVPQIARQQRAIAIGELLRGECGDMDAVIVALTEILGINTTASLGANQVGHRTREHQHVFSSRPSTGI